MREACVCVVERGEEGEFGGERRRGRVVRRVISMSPDRVPVSRFFRAAPREGGATDGRRIDGSRKGIAMHVGLRVCARIHRYISRILARCGAA